jgi:hypothetical protein
MKSQPITESTEQIIRFRIGIGRLSISYCAVSEKAEMQNVSTEAASYRVIENIGEYNKLVGMKKQLVNTAMQISMMEIIYACQKKLDKGTVGSYKVLGVVISSSSSSMSA